MARLKHSMTKDDYEKATSGKGAVLKPGVYRAKLIDFKDAKPEGKNPRWELIYEVSHGDGKGTRLYDYLTHADNAKWKKDQFFTAMGLVTVSGGKVKVADFDPDRLSKYPEVLARVINETYEEEQRHKLASVLPLDEDADDEDAESDEDEDPDAEDEEDEDEEGEDEDPDFDAMSAPQLREWAEENEIEIPAKVKGISKVRAFLVDKWEEMAVSEDDEDEESEDEDEDGDEEEMEEVDLATLKLPALRALADENDVDHEGLNAAKLRIALAEALGDEEEDEDGDDDEEDEVDYNTWSLAELKSELKDRGLKPVGSKAQLAKKLEKSDESDPV